MASGLQHIDDFFRKKNDSLSADSSSADLHWQQMQDNLHNDLSLPAKKPRRSLRPWMKYAAMVTVVASSLFVVITKPWKESNTKIKPTVSTGNTTPSIQKKKLQPVTRIGGSAANSAVPNTNTTTHVAKLKPGYTARKMPPVINDEPASVSKPDSVPNTIITEQNNTKVFVSFYNELKKPAEKFIIDTGKDTTIYCKEGTTLFIPASCFQTVTGLAVSGLLNINVQEFYSIADIVSNKLTTVSDGRPLITGGMLNITAMVKDQEVMIRPGAAIDVSMPTRIFDPNMQLFTAASLSDPPNKEPVSAVTSLPGSITPGDVVNAPKAEGINWVEAGQQQFYFNENKKILVLLNLTDNPYAIVNRNNKTIGKFRVPFYCSLTNEEVKKELEKKYGYLYDRIKVTREWKPLSARKREWRQWDKEDWYESGYVGDSIIISLHMACRLKMVTKDDSLMYEANWRKEYEEAVRLNKEFSQFVQIKNNYNFRISRLGGINCDRIFKVAPPRLSEFVVDAGEEFKSNDLLGIVILENQNMALPGKLSNGKIHFSKLPKGEAVNVICVGAKEGKVFCAVQKFRVGDTNLTLHFKETSPPEFRNMIARFGNVTTAR